MGMNYTEAFSVALIDAAFDKDESVRQEISQALRELGCSHPRLVLLACHSYLSKHSKLLQGHRIVILHTMEAIVKETISQLDQPLAKMIISLASEEMTKLKAIVPDWQGAASQLLVALGCRFINEVMEEILQKFQPGVLPHFFVVQTLGNLAMANVYGMVPFLTAILGTMLPMLGMAKHDSMKSVFTIALGRFSESILEYLANLDKAPDPTVRKDAFSSEIYTSYEILFNVWLQHKETKLRASVVDAVGHMSYLLPPDKLEEQLPKLIPGILTLYKKHSEHFHITQSLCHVLDAAVDMGSRVLETQIDNLLGILHPQVCTPLDYSNHMAVRNHNEVLRCFTVLARAYADRLIAFLLQRLEVHNERTRIGTLTVIKHLINSASQQLESKKSLILAGMKLTTQDNNKVKWMMAQVISAMAHHDYLELDGGEAMVEFIIRQCALPCEPGTPKPRSYDPDEVTDESLRTMCDNILHLLTTTVKKMENVLWPFLLEFVIPPQYLDALAPVCRSLAHLGMKKQQQHSGEGFQLNNKERDLPKPQALLTRLMVVSAFPFRGRGRGVSALRFLQVAVPLVHPQLLKVWNEELPSLIQYLEENSEDTLPQRHWEDKLLLLLSKSLEAVTVGDETWSGQLSEEMTKHLSNYSNHPSEKGFLYKCVGVVLRQTTDINVVRKQLVEVLHSVRHTEPLEREGVAVCIGFCAKTHLDVTLAKLEDFGKSDVLKKSPSLFQILKDKSDVDVEKAKSTLILCYGYLTLYAPKELILPRIEKDVIRQVLSHFNTKVLGIKVETKDLTIKLSLMKSISLIARAICANEQSNSYNFTRKRELLAYMQDLIKLEPMDVLRTPIRQHAMITCSHLLKLDPLVDETDMFELIKTCMDSVFGLPPLGMDRSKDEACTDIKEREILYSETLSALQELLKQILVQDLTPEGLQVIFKHVEGWITSRRDWERERAMIVTSKLLLFYLERLNVRTMVSFHNLGALIGRLVPRCTDPLVTVRQNALEGLYTLICIQLRYAGFAPDHSDECLTRLKNLQSGLHQSDSKLMFHTCSEIGQVVAKSLPQDQLSSLLFMLLEGLTDPHPHCSSAASVISNSLIRVRGSGLLNQISEVLEVLYIRLQIIAQEPVKASVLQTVSVLASQNLPAVISSLLSYPLPFDKATGEMWQSLAGDVTLARRSLEFLTERMNKQLPYDEKRESMLRKSVTRFATIQPLAVTCALTKLLSTVDSAEAVSILYPSLFSSLLGRVGCTVGVRLPKDPVKERQNRLPKDLDVCSCSVEALKLLTVRGNDEEFLKMMEQENGWDLMRSPDTHHQGVAVLARAMGTHGVTHLSSIVEQLIPMLSSPYEGQRITAVAFFGELLNHRVTSDLVLTDTLLSSLLPCLVDTSSVVRMLTIRGLGNAADGVPHKIHKYSTKLLSAMIAGMDEKDDPDDLITLEAMSGLSKVLKQLEEINVQPILINIALRIRPFFEKEKDAVRAAAFMVFGNLSRFGDGQSKADFVEQIHSSLVSLLLHLNDSSEEVVKACKFTLRSVGPLMGSESVSAMLQKHLLEEASLHYGEFINDLAKHLISDFPEKVNFYIMGNVSFFKSTWPEIRGNAVMFTGFLLGNLSQEELQSISLEHVCTAIILLLRDGVPSVRIKAAEALSLLHEL
ncbi:maestro heat-like repeat-containing protein family member 1 [Stegostoma tigrinum]|uniref:maestro heat-like repeat-containing protein family member 1 n=1 Tax=Stegostoma tigrinum TaxID=3053191 RepID=UPI002870472D|nr:maestro heat-like repeat-containing protein family member 1 [Stegostoma tigrinum]XP_059496594.1 maestro heat-like repeat-containing protein family member 1 [Stegostoma tigrinum]